MQPNQLIYDFLQALVRNNRKEWMDANRNWYFEARGAVTEFFDPILLELKSIDPRIVQQSAKEGLNRINNNLMFHPDRPVYKNHFGIGFGFGKGLADFYVELGVEKDMIAGGLWHPASADLKKVRSEIAYEGVALHKILSNKAFQKQFELYTEDRLKTTPKGYAKDHEFIELLRLKSIAAFEEVNHDFSLHHNFAAKVVASYKALQPLLDFINRGLRD